MPDEWSGELCENVISLSPLDDPCEESMQIMAKCCNYCESL